MVINKLQLTFKDYSWNAIPPDDPRVTGKADTIFVNRHEGYEMLDFLNRHCANLISAKKAERMMRNALPSTVRSRENILKWLNDNWSKHL